ncbi:hypothetical protein [Jannaschia ovalis]|uniref:SARP family transcriptional regulator n=1 Tax=Jannaschia ovalis TaxID=3038773 RepID=A0ABY8LEK4_9RHOB|nr:hypothetical protein [Jannaschia sp. GRR-S6-38]WGH79591.1 hypothetical protein P8627_04830 [Jannaschia sp. GRR-S6-38]
MTDAPRLRLHLTGPFRVETSDGELRTPVAAKAQGLLLLLALSPHGEHTRRWLQDKLWSDRAPEQGAGSLRQVLRQTRIAFGPEASILQADRQRVAIDLAAIEIVSEGHGELAEGLDARDPEFEDWLAMERAARAEAEPVPPARLALRTGLAATGPPAARRIRVQAAPSDEVAVHWLSQLVADGLARHLRERLSHEILRRDTGPSDGDLAIRIDGFRETGARVGLRVTLLSGAEGQQAWSGFRFVEQRGTPAIDDPQVQQLMVEAASSVETAIQARFGQGDPRAVDTDPDLLCRAAVRAIFSMAPEQLLSADDMLRRASAIRPHAVYDAWRAQIRVIQSVERHSGDPRRFRAEGERFGRIALEADPQNATAAAILANVHHFLLADSAGSLEFAERSVRLNPGNPMALWARSTARLYTGDTKLADQDALRGRFLMRTSEFRFFWDLQQFATSMVLGRADDALRLAQRASAQCPIFRPPHRYLTALHAHFGNEAGAVAQAERLRRLEPDFSIDRLLHDGAYPASLIHRAPNLRIASLASLV